MPRSETIAIAVPTPSLRESPEQAVPTPDGGTTVRHRESSTDASDPTGIFELSDRYIAGNAALDPMLASFWGIPGHDDKITDYSPDGWAERLEFHTAAIRELAQIAPQTRSDRIAVEVMRERIQAEVDLIESGEYHRWLSVMNSHHGYVREIFDFMPRESEEDWKNVRARLKAVPAALDNLRASFLYAAERGQVAARRQTSACGAQCDVWGMADGFFAELVGDCQSLDLGDDAARAANAFLEFGHWLQHDYAAMATDHDPVGSERYKLFARYHNGTDLDLDEAYHWGWQELSNIESRMSELVERILPGASRDECIGQLKTDPLYVIEGASNFIAWSQDVIDRTMEEVNGDYFDIAEPLRHCQAMPAPAGGPDSTYYTAPSEDFARPGQIWHHVTGKTHFPLWEALSTEYHESVPGHHLQIGQMMYQADSLTRFQRLGVAIAGHGEGWALYAERLMHELGYLDDPVYELGWLAGQALRAARVIVDIGLHCEMVIPTTEQFHPGERWRSELGLPFLLERTGYSAQYLSSEVDRYLGMPGQAISYKLGERVWLEGRARARARLGSKFDLKQFHRVVLDMGAMGLDQLSAELDLIDLSDGPG
jgi:uncharacterized protein (DUF885 family)